MKEQSKCSRPDSGKDPPRPGETSRLELDVLYASLRIEADSEQEGASASKRTGEDKEPNPEIKS